VPIAVIAINEQKANNGRAWTGMRAVVMTELIG
jgi:hypothetical protein